LNPSSKGDGASKIKIYFDVDMNSDWDLATTSQVQAIEITGKDWRLNEEPEEDWHIKLENESGSPIWTITHQNEEAGLAPGQVVQLMISNIISSLPSGNANLYLRYENIPGYWDGTFICTIEKSPIVYGNNGNVGIGTTDPGANKLKVQGDTTIVGNLNIALSETDFTNFQTQQGAGQLQIIGWSSGWNINTMTKGQHLYLNRDADQDSDVFIGVNTNELFVRGRDGNVGIGTTDPGVNKLKVQGDTEIAGTITANALQIGNIVIGENELRILKALADGNLQVDLHNAARNEYLYAPNDRFCYDGDRRHAFTWRRNEQNQRINSGQWNLRFPNPDPGS
jgi:hypothetical protein